MKEAFKCVEINVFRFFISSFLQQSKTLTKKRSKKTESDKKTFLKYACYMCGDGIESKST